MEFPSMRNLELDKICRLCLSVKKEMRPLFGDMVSEMLMEVARVQIDNTDGWPDKVCLQCVHQVSRCHAFKSRVEKSDQQLRQYIKGITVILQEPITQIELQPHTLKAEHSNHHRQEIQIQEISSDHPGSGEQQMIIMNGQAHNAQIINAGQIVTTSHGQQMIQTGQIVQHGQLVQTGNGTTMQMIQQNGQQSHQIVQIQRSGDDRCEYIVQPELPAGTEATFYEDGDLITLARPISNLTPVAMPKNVVSVQSIQKQSAQQQQQQQHQHLEVEEIIDADPDEEDLFDEEVEHIEHIEDSPVRKTELEDSDEACSIEMIDEDPLEEPQVEEHEIEVHEHCHDDSDSNVFTMNISDESECEDREYLAEFISMQTSCLSPGRWTCNLCHKEFKHSKWLHTHMKSHSNWIKANCKKLPQCQVCGRSFKGPGMLKMHMKTHEKPPERVPTCSICNKEFKTKTILYRHRQTHFEKILQCGVCDRSFGTANTLQAHMTKHKTGKSYKCGPCQKVYPVIQELKSHIAEAHQSNSKSSTSA